MCFTVYYIQQTHSFAVNNQSLPHVFVLNLYKNLKQKVSELIRDVRSLYSTGATLTVTSWPLQWVSGGRALLMTCLHVWGTEKTNGGVTWRLASFRHCLRLCHPDCVLLLIAIHELSRCEWGCFITTLPFQLQWLCDEALVACSQVQRVICLSVISVEWNGFPSQAFPLPITPGGGAETLLATCIYSISLRIKTHWLFNTHDYTYSHKGFI